MEWLYAVVSIISVMCSTVLAVVHSVISYKKSKEQKKDELWETTAVRIICSQNNGSASVDDVVEAYEALKLFRDMGYRTTDEPFATTLARYRKNIKNGNNDVSK